MEASLAFSPRAVKDERDTVQRGVIGRRLSERGTVSIGLEKARYTCVSAPDVMVTSPEEGLLVSRIVGKS